ncbi:Light-harvesting complex-like protein OHP1, chloroplastic [Vitis vinifera]|uniref:Light-harvesting complex-like protein OHP1, chloroplastic n=1 Tax=Vitis vinifera TaxID=29760 RepID=A0A438DEB8_VITVI|nr:Light-harvesting complex-like protein OHP1, chloroplastic [Vitis vinifera]
MATSSPISALSVLPRSAPIVSLLNQQLSPFNHRSPCSTISQPKKKVSFRVQAAKLPPGVELPKVEPKFEAPFLGFTRTAEIWNSRACMIGLIGIFIVELILNKGILQVLGVDIGKGIYMLIKLVGKSGHAIALPPTHNSEDATWQVFHHHPKTLFQWSQRENTRFLQWLQKDKISWLKMNQTIQSYWKCPITHVSCRGRGVYIEEGDRAYTGVVAAGEKRFMTVVRGKLPLGAEGAGVVAGRVTTGVRALDGGLHRGGCGGRMGIYSCRCGGGFQPVQRGRLTADVEA